MYDLYGTTDGSIPSRNHDGYAYDDFESFGGAAFAGSDFDFNPEDFARFFNGAGMGSRPPPQQHRKQQEGGKTEDAIFPYELTLEELYNGKIVKFGSTRNVICGSCKGTGAKKRAIKLTCQSCKGEGVKTRIVNMGGMMFRERNECSSCKGKGTYYRPKDACKKCKGKKVTEESKILEFNIPRGSPDVGSIVLKGEADQEPGFTPGDVILQYKTIKHKTFKRQGSDLYTKVSIPLVDALCGFKDRKLVKSLDNRWISVSVPPGKVLKQGDSVVIPDEGMPVLKSSNKNGSLFIGVDIEFPKDNWFLERNDLDKLRSILDISYGKTNNNDNDDDKANNVNECDVSNVSFTVKSKEGLPKSFNTYFNDTDVKNVGIEDSDSQSKGWFGFGGWL